MTEKQISIIKYALNFLLANFDTDMEDISSEDDINDAHAAFDDLMRANNVKA
jgi:hypothetical protein